LQAERQHCRVTSQSGTQTTKYTGYSDVTVIYGHDTISMLWGNTAYSVGWKSVKFYSRRLSEGNRILVRADKSMTMRGNDY